MISFEETDLFLVLLLDNQPSYNSNQQVANVKDNAQPSDSSRLKPHLYKIWLRIDKALRNIPNTCIVGTDGIIIDCEEGNLGAGVANRVPEQTIMARRARFTAEKTTIVARGAQCAIKNSIGLRIRFD